MYMYMYIYIYIDISAYIYIYIYIYMHTHGLVFWGLRCRVGVGGEVLGFPDSSFELGGFGARGVHPPSPQVILPVRLHVGFCSPRV